MEYFVYFLRCIDNSIYIGVTNNMEKRYQLHKERKAAKYTKSHPVKKIECTLPCESKQEAFCLEYFFKTWTKKEKESFLKNPSIELGKLLYKKKKEGKKIGEKK